CDADERINPAFRLDAPSGWSQWGRSAAHQSNAGVIGQHPRNTLANFVYDPFTEDERMDGHDDLLLHYQSPLLDGDDVFMEAKSGRYTPCPMASMPPEPRPPCGSATWNLQEWNEKRFVWENGALVEKWTFKSDWHPPPDDGALRGWEPVFHAA